MTLAVERDVKTPTLTFDLHSLFQFCPKAHKFPVFIINHPYCILPNKYYYCLKDNNYTKQLLTLQYTTG